MCSLKYCRKCLRAPHEGSCVNVSRLDEYETTEISSFGYKKCPICHTIVEKNGSWKGNECASCSDPICHVCSMHLDRDAKCNRLNRMNRDGVVGSRRVVSNRGRDVSNRGRGVSFRGMGGGDVWHHV